MSIEAELRPTGKDLINIIRIADVEGNLFRRDHGLGVAHLNVRLRLLRKVPPSFAVAGERPHL